MKIGIDARFFGSIGKGLGRYTEKLIEHLENIDQKNEYIIFLRRENFDEYIPRNPRFKKVLADYSWYGFSEQICFPWKLFRERLDVVHFPHFNVPLLYPRRFVVTVHDLILFHHPTLRNTTRTPLLYGLKYLVYRIVIASAIARAEKVLTVSWFTAHDLERHFPKVHKKLSMAYEGMETFCVWMRPEESISTLESFGLLESIPFVLYVGNAYPHKNLDLLLHAAKRFPGYRFVFVGKKDYFYERLEFKARQMGLRNILFLGYVDDRQLSVLYRYTKAYVFPSLYEGFGLPPLEASLYGAPVLASSAGSLPEILGETAEYFDPRSITSFLEKFKKKIVEPSRSLDIDYVRFLSQRYRWEELAKETLSVYESSRR